jgi:hypothetical protein
VASIAFDSSGSRDASKPPISLHPAFPAVVALWFAALLGLGSMVLPVALIERVVEITGFSALVPAAAPPLGFTARGLIALGAALTGAAIGVAIARRVARAHDGSRPSRVAKFAKGARRPIDVNEELGGEGLVNGFSLPVNRRRALAIAEDDRPSDFLYMAPLPGHEDDHAPAFDQPAVAPTAAEEPLELSDAFEDTAEAGEPEASDPTEQTPAEDAPMTMQEFQPPSPEPRAEARQEFVPVQTRSEAAPLPFSAPSLARRAQEEGSAAPELKPAPAIPEAYEPEPDEPLRFEPAPEPQPFRGDWTSAPLGELGLVQLVQRLGASLERRREWLATAAPAPTAASLLAPTAGFEPAPAEEAVQAMAAYFGKPADDAPAETDAVDETPQPAPFAPVDLAPRPTLHGSWPVADDEDDGDALPSFTLPLHKAVAPTIAFDDPEPENDDEDDSYSSLLAMRNPFAAPKEHGFVRIDEPEDGDETLQSTVVFPGQGEAASAAPGAGFAASRAFDPPADEDALPARSHAAPADADAALRSALATLQRMSGTA